MNIKVIKVKGYSCPKKHLIMVNDKPLIFVNSMKRASKIVTYLEGYEVEIEDKAVKRLLDQARLSEVV